MRISVGSEAGVPSPGFVCRSSVIGVAARHASSSSLPSMVMGEVRCAAEVDGTGADSCAEVIFCVGRVCCAEIETTGHAQAARATTTARREKTKDIGEVTQEVEGQRAAAHLTWMFVPLRWFEGEDSRAPRH